MCTPLDATTRCPTDNRCPCLIMVINYYLGVRKKKKNEIQFQKRFIQFWCVTSRHFYDIKKNYFLF